MTLEQLREKLDTLEKILCSRRWSRKATHEWLDMIDGIKQQIKKKEGNRK